MLLLTLLWCWNFSTIKSHHLGHQDLFRPGVCLQQMILNFIKMANWQDRNLFSTGRKLLLKYFWYRDFIVYRLCTISYIMHPFDFLYTFFNVYQTSPRLIFHWSSLQKHASVSCNSTGIPSFGSKMNEGRNRGCTHLYTYVCTQSSLDLRDGILILVWSSRIRQPVCLLL